MVRGNLFGSGTKIRRSTRPRGCGFPRWRGPTRSRPGWAAPEKGKPKRLPPYAVVVLNDDEHTFQYVIETFRKVFGYSMSKCLLLAMLIHTSGRAAVWTGPKEVAELKHDVKDIGLAPAGKDRIAWADDRMPVLRSIRRDGVLVKKGGGSREIHGVTIDLEIDGPRLEDHETAQSAARAGAACATDSV